MYHGATCQACCAWDQFRLRCQWHRYRTPTRHDTCLVQVIHRRNTIIDLSIRQPLTTTVIEVSLFFHLKVTCNAFSLLSGMIVLRGKCYCEYIFLRGVQWPATNPVNTNAHCHCIRVLYRHTVL